MLGLGGQEPTRTAPAVTDVTDPELLRLLLDIAARVAITVTAADDHDGNRANTLC
ncbi:hypothetical protein [Streptomyces sp. NPDC048111]|uniref:hypothetical protein n=1 Tax=Streptomyces sp. NPDC048111 TaxID=3365500 RepID=UPI003712D396